MQVTQIKIYGTDGILQPRRSQLSDVLHGCVIEAFSYPHDKRAHRFFAVKPEDFYKPAGRTDDYTILEINLFAGRSLAAKRQLYALIFERFERELGIDPIDIEITLIETPRHDWAMRGQPGDQVAINYDVDV